MKDFEREIIDRLARIEENLKDHIRRTELLEAELRPCKQHVTLMTGSLKILGLVSLVSGIALTIVRLWT